LQVNDKVALTTGEPNRLNAISWTCIAGLCALPHVTVWDNGGSLPWTGYWICSATGVLATLSLPLIFWRRRVKNFESLTLPLLAILVWCVAFGQTVSLPSSLVGWLSSGTSRAYTEFVPQEIWNQVSQVASESVPSPSQSKLDGLSSAQFPISICRWLTRQALMTPALFGLTVFLAMFVFQNRTSLLALMGATAAAGAIFSFVALVDTVQANDYENVTDPELITTTIVNYGATLATFGSFVNRNSSALYINLGLACTVGLLVNSRLESRRTTVRDSAYELKATNKLEALRFGVEQYLREADVYTVGLVILGVLQFVGVLASASRGGLLASLAGFAVAIVASQKKRQYLWTAMPLLVAAIGVVVLLDQLDLTEHTQARVQSIFTLEEGSQVGRIAHWQDGLRAAKAYFPMGAGLGTYSFAYLPYQTFSCESWFVNADNMFVEWLVEGGVWLLTCIAAGAVFVIRALGRLRAISIAPHLDAIAAMGWYLAGALVVSQFFDFGILYPSNLMTVGLLVGAIMGADARQYKRRVPRSSAVVQPGAGVNGATANAKITSRSERYSRFALLGLVLAYAVIFALTIHWAGQGAWADFDMRSLDGKNESMHPGSQESTVDELLVAANGDSYRSQSPMLKLSAANAILDKQWAAAIDQMPASLTLDEKKLFRAISKIEFRRFAYYSESRDSGSSLAPEAALLPGQSMDELRIARRLACEAMVQCPLEVRARWILIATGFLEKDTSEFTQLLADQSADLWPNSSLVLTRVARLVLPFPGREAASPYFARVLSLHANQFDSLWPFIESGANDELISNSIPDDPEALLVAIESNLISESARQVLAQRAKNLLKVAGKVLPKSQVAAMKGRLAFRTGDMDTAVLSLAESVLIDPSDVNVRFTYAEALEARGDLDAANKQIKRCLVQSPANERFLEALRRLNGTLP